jgi:hypothetical protein
MTVVEFPRTPSTLKQNSEEDSLEYPNWAELEQFFAELNIGERTVFELDTARLLRSFGRMIVRFTRPFGPHLDGV